MNWKITNTGGAGKRLVCIPLMVVLAILSVCLLTVERNPAYEILYFGYGYGDDYTNTVGVYYPSTFLLGGETYEIITNYTEYVELLERADALADEDLQPTVLEESFFQENAVLAVEIQRPNTPVFSVELSHCAIWRDRVRLTVKIYEAGYTANMSGVLILIQVSQAVTRAEVTSRSYSIGAYYTGSKT